MNIYDIDSKLGCWIDGSHWSATDFNTSVIYFALNYGYKIHPPTLETDEDWHLESEDAYDYLNSICPHGYWFEIEDNSLFLRSEDE